MKIIKGNLIELALNNQFDIIAHGCNCFCKQKSGIAKEMVKYFKTDNFTYFPKESLYFKGDINKLGTIDHFTGSVISKEFDIFISKDKEKRLTVVNCYTQYRYGMNHPDGQYAPFDYNAFRLCMRKINHIFAGKKVGLPLIGGGLAGGNHNIIKNIMKQELYNVDLTLVLYEK
jgi:O-acetyl-ADP-ribose deacetylase (regulator of RNase III)